MPLVRLISRVENEWQLLSDALIAIRDRSPEFARRPMSVRHATLSLSLSLFLLPGLFAVTAAAAQTVEPPPEYDTKLEQLEIPAGTILPVRLHHALSSKCTRPGRQVTGRIMQDVPLPNHQKIPEGATLSGTILSVERAGNGANGKITFCFDVLEFRHHKYPIVASLRALAGFMEVQSAQTPEFSPGFGTPYAWATTRQIGGDEVFGVGGPVTNQHTEIVGKGVYGGVLVHVRAQPESRCRGAFDAEDRLQALWVFSSDACGVYGIQGVKIAHAGRTNPVGEISLVAEHQDLLIRGACGMLLRLTR